MSLIRYNAPLWRPLAAPKATPVAWRPRTDVYDAGDSYVLRFDLPGVDEKEVDVKEENGLLSVSGERRAPENGQGVGYTLRERVNGPFERTFRLPDAVDPEKIEARYERGVLEVRVPKVDRSRKIPIQ